MTAHRTLCATLVGAGLCWGSTVGAAPPFADGKLSFSLAFRGLTTSYRELAVPVMPGELLLVEAASPAVGDFFEAAAVGGALRATGRRTWEWRAPDAAGLYPLTVRSRESGETMRLNLFVLVPATRVRNGRLNGYRIDDYPSKPLRGLEAYLPPRGFIEVTAANVDTPLSPHFTLRQFLCKQKGGYPKYVVLRELLLLKLELLLERANAAGLRCDTFHVMSGYRTPFYNRSIGNVKYSRHLYGGAADIFIDERPRDGQMDDLNGDGKINVHDAGVLYDLIDGLSGSTGYRPFIGGLGRYKPTAAHGPFVHVDVRGFRSRWGD